MTSPLPQNIGRYKVLRRLGEGGMGFVYVGYDERLDRSVAIKIIRRTQEPSDAERFMREARAAASVSHPNICAIYDVGEDPASGLYLAMELLEGESLADRLQRGPLPLQDAMRILCDILGALDALHDRHLIHRDLKPSNVFITKHGVKLLDFGLARSSATDPSVAVGLTQTGIVLGTPRYMAPEQVSGLELDGRADLFAAGLLLYEMLSGNQAFPGDSMMQVLHAVVYDTPPPLDPERFPPALLAMLDRAMAKNRDERFESAAEMAIALRQAGGDRQPSTTPSEYDTTATTHVRPATRLAVLPFRMLRPDPEIDFLAFSLPDAVASALAGLNALTVRPSGTIAGLVSDIPDLARIGREANVDVVMMGTLLRAGDQVRVTTQLLQVPSGTLIASHTSQSPLGDLFLLQDEMAQRIVDALSLPLTTREKRLVHRDVPADPAAYELFLRANQLMNQPDRWPDALDLYQQVVGKDAHYAPAWAQLGRAARVMAKFGDREQSQLLRTAEGAFRRALELNPDLSIAHHLHAYLDVELGRARFAMVRLLDRARARRNDPELYSGLVIACRYCGLLQASAAAHVQAQRLDPGIRSSVGYTYLFELDWDRCLTVEDAPLYFIHILALQNKGEYQRARDLAERTMERGRGNFMRLASRGYSGAAEGNVAPFMELVEFMRRSSFSDPEALALVGRGAAKLGLRDVALEIMGRAVQGGHTVPSWMRTDPWFQSLQGLPEFDRLVRDAEKVRGAARAHFLAAGGEQLLGVGTAGAP